MPRKLWFHLSEREDEDQKPLLTLRWCDGATVLLRATDRLRPAAERWISRGLSEYVGNAADLEPRHTPSSAEEFLPRLKTYLDMQFDFEIGITVDDDQARNRDLQKQL